MSVPCFGHGNLATSLEMVQIRPNAPIVVAYPTKPYGAGSMTFSQHHFPLLPLAACAAALSGALAAQYGLGWHPCELCLLQRVPLILAGLAALLALWPGHHPLVRAGLLRLIGWVFLGTAVLAFYHVGVEQHWWIYHGSCAAEHTAAVGPIDFASALSRPVVVSCDTPPWIWHGLTMAGLNVFFSATVGMLTLLGPRVLQGRI